jgi:hypothetical protein
MNARPFLLAAALAGFLPFPLPAGETMDLTSSDGRTINAEVLDIGADAVKVKVNGKEFSIAFDKLKEETVATLKTMADEKAGRGTIEAAENPGSAFPADASTVFARFNLTAARPAGEKLELTVKGGTLTYSAAAGTIFYEIDCSLNTEVTLPAPAPSEGSIITFRSNWLMASRQAGEPDETRCVGWLDTDDMFYREAYEQKKTVPAGTTSAKARVRGRLIVLAPPGATVFHVRCLAATKVVTVADEPRPAETPAEQLEKMIEKLTAALESNMPVEKVMETWLLPEEYAKLNDGSKMERLAKDYYEKEGAELLAILQSLDVGKATITDDKAEFAQPSGKPFTLVKSGDKWYLPDT